MKVTWEVEDHYAGKSRPQYTEVDDDELAECETPDEWDEVIENAVQDDFDNNIFWAITSTERDYSESK